MKETNEGYIEAVTHQAVGHTHLLLDIAGSFMLIRVKTSTQAKKIMPGDHFRWEECKGFFTPRRNKNRTGLKFASYDIPVDVTSLPWTPAALENTSTEELNEEEDETNWNFLDFWNQDDD